MKDKSWSLKKKIGLGIGVVFAVYFGLIVLSSSLVFDDSTKIRQEILSVEDSKESKNNEKEVLSPEEIKENAIEISYDDLFRNNERYVGKIVYYNGEITQLMYHESSVLKDSYTLIVTLFDDNLNGIMVGYNGPIGFLEGDTVDIWGEVRGIVDTETIFGEPVSVPVIKANLIEPEGSKESSGSIHHIDEMNMYDMDIVNWDADIEKDGLLIESIKLKDENDKNLRKDVVVNVKLYIYPGGSQNKRLAKVEHEWSGIKISRKDFHRKDFDELGFDLKLEFEEGFKLVSYYYPNGYIDLTVTDSTKKEFSTRVDVSSFIFEDFPGWERRGMGL